GERRASSLDTRCVRFAGLHPCALTDGQEGLGNVPLGLTCSTRLTTVSDCSNSRSVNLRVAFMKMDCPRAIGTVELCAPEVAYEVGYAVVHSRKCRPQLIDLALEGQEALAHCVVIETLRSSFAHIVSHRRLVDRSNRTPFSSFVRISRPTHVTDNHSSGRLGHSSSIPPSAEPRSCRSLEDGSRTLGAIASSIS